VIQIGDSEEVEVGEPVAAIGHPGGGGLWTLTTGTVSSVRRDGVRDVFQTDTAINPGNSGGPLLDENARLIGVNTFVRRVNKQGLPLEGLNYSLRSALALEWLGDHGVGLAAVRRADPVPVPTPPIASPQPAAEPTPPSPTPAPRVEPTPAPSASRPDPSPSTRPSPPVGPSPADIIPAPEPMVEEDAPRAFEGENGEEMFGVPNKSFRLDSAMKEAYKRTLESASSAFDELDGSFDEAFDAEFGEDDER
jgi:serine protease Do